MKTFMNLQFEKMDALSQKKVPFFFLVDFKMEKVEIYENSEIESAGILVDFPNFKCFPTRKKTEKYIELLSFSETIEEYRPGFEVVQNNLKKGNSYLTNYTRNSRIECILSLQVIFYAAEAKYKVLYKSQFVFFSPEIFVEIKNQKIYTHPMKGTIDAATKNAIEVLKADKKEKAEHYTVVDLLRNDLSMVADQVTLEEFQRIDYLQTHQKNLYAMSSEISGDIKPEFQNKIGTILKTLFPAGSILGAPKQKTMEIILEAEGFDRGFYTGVCGYFDGENVDSCVMIRFIEKEEDQLYFKSGGGITHLSKMEDEYQEVKNKIYVPIH